ncbi:transposase [Microbulbifer sp. ANSA003]|uniref:transposase n=1 Tax=Microbulbifer sp. ANSA003 TaxID=3243360 RepID=UPI0040424426
MGKQVIITTDTGLSNDANYSYLRENSINAYIPDNKFRSRDKAFVKQKTKYGKRKQKGRNNVQKTMPASELTFNKKNKTCICPVGKAMLLLKEEHVSEGKKKLLFEGRLTGCRECSHKNQCMRNPDSADPRKGHGRQVSLTWTNGRPLTG